MTQVFEDKKLVPVTVIEVASNFVVQIKKEEKEGYNAIALGFEDKREKLVSKPEMGVFKKQELLQRDSLRNFMLLQ